MSPQTRLLNDAAADRRADYRIRYPAALRPLMWLGPGRYEVLDVSEQGLRFGVPAGSRRFGTGESLLATVHFHAGGSEAVTGEIVRVERGAAAARLRSGPGFRTIAREFDWLMEHQQLEVGP